MKILITGSSGFLGRNIVKSLQNKHDIYFPSSNELDLTNAQQVTTYLQTKYFDVVIHCAIKGGSRLQPDTSEIMYQNLSMFFHLMDNRDRFDKFFNFGSGAEFDRRKGICSEIYKRSIEKSFPIDYYGMSKNIISRIIRNDKKAYNIRIYNVFGEDELNTRFIKSNIQRYIDGEDMVIHQNKLMDFFYIKDLITLVNYYINYTSLPYDIDCSYDIKYSLYDIANIINNLTEKKVNIIIENKEMGNSYIGNPFYLPNGFIGLEEGIKNVYNKLI